ncbi:MAG: hypothetical protein JWM95_5215 [Gemmatimonadetes bacterium]|nr:hypothetical protein [Gemmatimonadota bacterium]
MGGSRAAPDDGRVELLPDGNVRFTHMRRAFAIYDLTVQREALKRVPHGDRGASWRAFIPEDGNTLHCSLGGWNAPRDLSGRTLVLNLGY